MIRIAWDQGFKRIYKKKIKYNNELKKKFWEAIVLFSKNPFNPRLKTHKLIGKLEGFWAFRGTAGANLHYSIGIYKKKR